MIGKDNRRSHMAQRAEISYVDDTDPTQVAVHMGVPFSWEGVDYRIDVSDPNYQKMKDAFEFWVKHATRTGGRKIKGSGNGLAVVDRSDMRDWLRQNGYPDLSDRGRIPIDAMEKYDAHHAAPQPKAKASRKRTAKST